jgi:hypothetical protein
LTTAKLDSSAVTTTIGHRNSKAIAAAAPKLLLKNAILNGELVALIKEEGRALEPPAAPKLFLRSVTSIHD